MDRHLAKERTENFSRAGANFGDGMTEGQFCSVVVWVRAFDFDENSQVRAMLHEFFGETRVNSL